MNITTGIITAIGVGRITTESASIISSGRIGTKRTRNAVKIAKNFYLYEFECHGNDCCGHLVKVEAELIEKLQKLRKEVGKKLIVNSGYRCPAHNKSKKVEGKPNSFHLEGMAADVTVTHFDIRELARLAKHVGFGTIIAYPHRGIIHVDVRQKGLGLIGA